MTVPDLPWWLGGTVAQSLKSIAQTCWAGLESKLAHITSLARTSTTTATGVNILWSELPLKPLIDVSDRRNFIRIYGDYLNTLGTADGVHLGESMFGFTSYLVSQPSIGAHGSLYPYHALRITVAPYDAGLLTRMAAFLREVLPARCVHHVQIVPHYPNAAAFGSTPLNQNFAT